MRFRSGRAVAAGAAAAIAVTSVAVAASPPISSSGRHAQRAARVDLEGSDAEGDPPDEPGAAGGSLDNAGASATARLARALRPGHREPADRRPAGRRPPRRLPHRPLERERDVDRARLRARPRHGVRARPSRTSTGLKLVRDYTSSPDGVRHLQWAQVVDGVTVADSSVLANVASDGRLVNVLGGARGGTLNRRSPAVSADGAYQRTLRSVGSRSSVPKQRTARSTGTRDDHLRGQRARRARRLPRRAGPRSPGACSRPSAPTALRLARRRRDRPHRAARQPRQVRGRAVFDAAPGDHPGGTQTRKPIGQWLTPRRGSPRGQQRARVPRRPRRGRPGADRGRLPGSLHAAVATATSRRRAARLALPDPERARPGRRLPRRRRRAARGIRHGAGLVAAQPQRRRRRSSSTSSTRSTTTSPPRRSASTRLGQLRGRPTRVLAQADDGADTAGGLPGRRHINNANMRHAARRQSPAGCRCTCSSRPRAGSSARSRRQRRRRRRDRLPRVHARPLEPPGHRRARLRRLDGAQSGAMGEAWSDWYALDFLVAQGLETDDRGAAATSTSARTSTTAATSSAREPIDCPVGARLRACPARRAGAGRLHVRGLRRLHATATSAGSPAAPRSTPTARSGRRRCGTCARRSSPRYGAGRRLRPRRAASPAACGSSPPEPSFLDMRNAILQADSRRRRRHRPIWEVFAARGMGYFAFDSRATTTTSPTPTSRSRRRRGARPASSARRRQR